MGTHGVRKTASGLPYKTSYTDFHANHKKRAQKCSQEGWTGDFTCR